MMHKILPHPHVTPQQHHHIHHMAPPPPQHINANAGPPMNMAMNMPPQPQPQPNAMQAAPAPQQQPQHHQPYHQITNRTLQQHHTYHPQHQHQHQRMSNNSQPTHIHPSRGNYHPAGLPANHNSNNPVRGHVTTIPTINTNAMVSMQPSQLSSPQPPQAQHLGPQQQPPPPQHPHVHIKPTKVLHHQTKSGKPMQILKPNRPPNAGHVNHHNGNAEKLAANRTNAVPATVVNNSATDSTSRKTESDESVQVDENNIIMDNGEQSNDGHTLKVKTPMCLVNELARHNHFQHQYRLIKETGPAHNKSFTVTLKLGEESYTAEGKSIKKAQHSAAADAIKATQYPHPPEKTQRPHTLHGKHGNGTSRPNNSLTPMVELNAILMKMGRHPSYSVQYPADMGRKFAKYNNNNNNNNTNTNNNNTRHVKGGHGFRQNSYPYQTTPDNPYRVVFTVEGKEYTGEGITLQGAKHEAAARAIVDLKTNMPLAAPEICANTIAADGTQLDTSTLDLTKSAISLVYEIALKRNLHISFNVENETGPAHMKHFITKCTVGEISTIGEGSGKKASKKAAAEKMLEELQKLPPLPVEEMPTPRQPTNRSASRVKKRNVPVTPVVKKKPRNLIKDVVRSDNGVVVEDEVTNPISRLLRIQQARKQKDPVYTVIEERGQQRRKEFVMEVVVNGERAEGVGPNKKVAKRIAAENIMIKLGFTKPSDTADSDKTAATVAGTTTEKFKRSGKKEQDRPAHSGGSEGRQLAPGLILMKNVDDKVPDVIPSFKYKIVPTTESESQEAEESISVDEATAEQSSSPQKTVTDDRSSETSATEESPEPAVASEQTSTTTSASIASTGANLAIGQLRYLADLLKFEIQFSDFPKGTHSDCLTLLSLNTDPPQMFHGSGNNSEASQNQAAMMALKALSELGLDNVNKKPT